MTTISVIIPLHDHAATIAAAVDSALQQTITAHGVHVEVLVIDDASTDGGPELLAGREVTLLRQPVRSGAASARNVGAVAATGEVLAFLDSDDVMPTDRLLVQWNALQSHSGAGAVSGMVQEFAEPGWTGRQPFAPMASRILGALLLHRWVWEQVGGLDESVVGREVVEWGARFARSGITVIEVGEVVLLRRLHAANHGLDDTHVSELLRTARAHLLASRKKPS